MNSILTLFSYLSQVLRNLEHTARVYDIYKHRLLMVFAASFPQGVALDPYARLLYYVDPGQRHIGVVSLESPKTQAVLVNQDLGNPRGIAVDHAAG